MVGPSQFLPPHRGAGLSQDLERHKQELTPSTPSSLLQGCHGAQGPKPPLVVWFRSWKTNKWRLGARRRSRFRLKLVLPDRTFPSKMEILFFPGEYIDYSPIYLFFLYYCCILSCLVQHTLRSRESRTMLTTMTCERWHQRATWAFCGAMRTDVKPS